MINHLGLVTSNICPNACKYCYRGEQKPIQMPLDIAKKAIDETLEQLADDQQLSVTFLGGEPMVMFVKLLKPLLEHYENHNIKWIICSNGQIAVPEWLEFLSKYDIRFALSLDGIQEAHDFNRITKTGQPTWQKVMDNLPILFKYFPDMHIQATFSPETIPFLYESYLFHEKLGFKEWYYAPDIYTHWPHKSLQALSQQLDKLVKYYLTSPESPRFSLIDNYLSDKQEKRGNARFEDKEHNVLVEPTGHYKISRLSATESTEEIDKEFYINSIKEANAFFSLWDEDADQLYYANQDEKICLTCPAKDLCTTPHNTTNIRKQKLASLQPSIQCYQKRLLYLSIDKYKHLNERKIIYS